MAEFVANFTLSEIESIDATFVVTQTPTLLSELTDDSTHRLVTDVQINNWDSKQEAGDYATNTALTNGLALKVDKIAGYSLISDTDLTRLADTSGVNTGDETQATILNKIGYTPADDTTVVHKTGDESVGGVKTFTSAPIFRDRKSVV